MTRLSAERFNMQQRIKEGQRAQEPEHRVSTSLTEDGLYQAKCSCGWIATSVSGGLRNWNVAGHLESGNRP